jgi:hypothetical protein
MTLKPTAAGRGAGDLSLLLGSLAIVALLAGCASYDGRGLVPGQSRAGDVEAQMGPPTEKIALASGESLWFYLRNPGGRHSYAVRIGADGVVRSVEQRLTVQNVRTLRPGMNAREVREILGPPWRVAGNIRQGGEVWDYRMYDDTQMDHNLSVRFSADGALREVYVLRDMVNEPTGM